MKYTQALENNVPRKKLLTICNYITDDQFSQLTKNTTGYGYIVGDIVNGLSCKFKSTVYTYSGNFKAFKYGKSNVSNNQIKIGIANARLIDFYDSLKYLVKKLKHKKEALRVVYSYLSRGYLSKIIEANDIVHIHGCTPNLIPYIELSIGLGKKTVVTLHGLNSFSGETKATSLVRESEKGLLILLKTSRNLTLSVLTPAAKNIICKYIGEESRDKISVIPNFINSNFAPQRLERRKSLEKLVLYVGNLSIQKNQKSLLKVLRRSWKDYQGQVKFVFIGEVCDNFDEEFQFFKDKVDVVEFTGHMHRESLVDYYRKASLVVLLSKVEGFGMSIIEGFSAGVPCLINREMEISSLLEDESFITRVDNINDSKEVEAKLGFALACDTDCEEIQAYSKKYTSGAAIAAYSSLLRLN